MFVCFIVPVEKKIKSTQFGSRLGRNCKLFFEGGGNSPPPKKKDVRNQRWTGEYCTMAVLQRHADAYVS